MRLQDTGQNKLSRVSCLAVSRLLCKLNPTINLFDQSADKDNDDGQRSQISDNKENDFLKWRFQRAIIGQLFIEVLFA